MLKANSIVRRGRKVIGSLERDSLTAMKNIIFTFLLFFGCSGLFNSLNWAHADTPNQIPSEYTPQELPTSTWLITDEYNSNVLKNLTDHNPATYSTISSNPLNGTAGFVINLGAPTVIDRLYLTGPKSSQRQSSNVGNSFGENLPLGMIRVYVGNTPTPTTQVAELMVSYNAGNPVDIDADLRFQPMAGQYIRVELQTADMVWSNYSAAWPKILTPPVNLPWNVSEIEIHGFAGQSSITPQEAKALPTDDESVSLLSALIGDVEDASNSWSLKKRTADILAGYNWIISQRQLTTVNLSNTSFAYQTVGESNQEIDLNLANGNMPLGQSAGGNGGIWYFQGPASIYQLLNFSQGGVYKIDIQAYSTAVGENYLSSAYAYLGPILLGTINVTSQTQKDFIFTVSVPDHFAIEDFLISMGLGTGPMSVSKVSITRM